MALDDRQLAVVLQASLEKAGDLLVHDGGFLPFGARAKPDGQVEFVQIGPEDDEEAAALYGRLGGTIAEEAQSGTILGSALVAVVSMDAGAESGEAISVLLETPGYCRAIVVPYVLDDGAVEFGTMAPQAASPVVFTG